MNYTWNPENATDDMENTWSGRDISLTTYGLLSLFLGLFGNTFFLVASCFYKALELDKISLVFLRNIAMVNLMLLVNTLSPSVVTLIGRGWVLGKSVCNLSSHFMFGIVLANLYLVLGISTIKILGILMPFTMRKMTRKHAWGAVVVVYLVSGAGSMESVLLGKIGQMVPDIDGCLSQIFQAYPVLMMWNLIIPVGIPLIAIIAVNINLFIKARQINSKSKVAQCYRQTLLTLSSISSLFILSWIPTILYASCSHIIVAVNLPWVIMAAFYFFFISPVGFPFIFLFTNKKFRDIVNGIFCSNFTRAMSTMYGSIRWTEVQESTHLSFKRSVKKPQAIDYEHVPEKQEGEKTDYDQGGGILKLASLSEPFQIPEITISMDIGEANSLTRLTQLGTPEVRSAESLLTHWDPIKCDQKEGVECDPFELDSGTSGSSDIIPEQSLSSDSEPEYKDQTPNNNFGIFMVKPDYDIKLEQVGLNDFLAQKLSEVVQDRNIV